MDFLKLEMSRIINLWDSNIADISGALFILRHQYEYSRTRCEVGARDVNNIWVAEVISFQTQAFVRDMQERSLAKAR